MFLIRYIKIVFYLLGKQKPGETILDAAVRELEEESGIRKDPSQLIPKGIIMFEFVRKNLPNWFFEVHIFTGDYSGEQIIESDEMEPHWFSIESVPFSLMWDDDKFWLPSILSGGYVLAFYRFDDETHKMLGGTSEILLPSSMTEETLSYSSVSASFAGNKPILPTRFPKDFHKWISTGGFYPKHSESEALTHES